MSKLDDVKTKIAALLEKNVKNGATEDEATAAMALAVKMMQKYGVSLDDIKNKSVSAKEFVSKYDPNIFKQKHPVDQYVSGSIAAFTDTKCIFVNKPGRAGKKYEEKGRGYGSTNSQIIVEFFGYSVDVELAMYLREMCKSAMETEFEKYLAAAKAKGVRTHGKKLRTGFMGGMGVRLAMRLQEMKREVVAETATGTELVLYKKAAVDNAFAEAGRTTVPVKMTKKYFDEGAMIAGIKAANTVPLARPLDSEKSAGPKLLTA